MTNPIERSLEPGGLEPDTLTLTDLDVEEQGEQVRGGNPCLQGQHYVTATVSLQPANPNR